MILFSIHPIIIRAVLVVGRENSPYEQEGGVLEKALTDESSGE